MTSAPAGEPVPAPHADARVVHRHVEPETYLDLYRRIGDPLGWDGRLDLGGKELASFLQDATIDHHLLEVADSVAGFCEVDRADWPSVEIVHFGIVPELQGQRLGPFLLDRTLRAIWALRPQRIWLHTDTWDHPKALDTYLRAGFVVFAERMIDSAAPISAYRLEE